MVTMQHLRDKTSASCKEEELQLKDSMMRHIFFLSACSCLEIYIYLA
jgi:hypothetical protein